jgi:tRNA 2-thiouridine synthesizing protein D
MSSYIVTIHSPAWSHQSVATACEFAEQVIKLNKQLKAIFLYQEGVLNSIQSLDIPSDELNGQNKLVQLSKQHQVPILLCATAAEKRGITPELVNPHFTFAGLAEFAELSTDADHVIQFK